MLWTPVPLTLTLGEDEENRTWDFLAVVGSSQAEAQAYLQEALKLQARGTLYPAHAQAWAQLWAGCGLDVVGPLPLRQALRGSLYYLLSALPQPGALGYVCHGLSPGGLSNGSQEECYWGHVFWDQVHIIPHHRLTEGSTGIRIVMGKHRAVLMGRLPKEVVSSRCGSLLESSPSKSTRRCTWQRPWHMQQGLH